MRVGARYRWVVLGVGTGAQASVSAVFLGVAVLAPQLRGQSSLTLGQAGVMPAAARSGLPPACLFGGVLAPRGGWGYK
mgnify:CR=1 FL=1